MNNICRIHPKLQPYIMALTAHEFGLQGAQAEIKNIECGSIVTNNRRNWGDRFHLTILYCTKRLTWQVLMSPNNLFEPPDFIMEEDFLSDADVGLLESKVPSLAHWQPSDPKCLLNVVLELLQLYKHFQGRLLTVNCESRLSLEYEALMNFSNISLSDLEIFVHNTMRVSLLTHLKVDFSKLPIPVPKQKYLTLLLIELGENSKNVVSLIKRGELDEVFGSIDLPELRSENMLMTYIPQIEKFLQMEVDEIVKRVNKRKILYSYLLQQFEPAILNGDNITFHSISFLLEDKNIYYIINVEIPVTFPDDRPVVSVSSMRRQKGCPTLFVTLKRYNYDSQWDVKCIFKNLFDFIKSSAIPQYRRLTSFNEPKTKK